MQSIPVKTITMKKSAKTGVDSPQLLCSDHSFQPKIAKNATPKFITISGHNLLSPTGEKFFIRGINLGNCAESGGYMFGFKGTQFRPFD